MATTQSVQCFGKKKTGMSILFQHMYTSATDPIIQQPLSHIAKYPQLHHHPKPNITANRQPQAGKGLVKVNGKPLSLTQPEILRFKVRLPPSSQSQAPSNHVPVSGLRTPSHSRPRQIRQCRYPGPRYWRGAHLPDIRHSPSNRQIDRRLLPEICGRICEEPAEAGAGAV